MKKATFILFALITFSSLAQQQQRVYTLQLNETGINLLFYVIGKSTAEHNNVSALEQELAAQLRQQMDSLKNDTSKNKHTVKAKP